MRRVAALLLVLVPAVPAHAEERVFLELETSSRTCFVQEPIRVRLRFGFDGAYFREFAVQPYRQELDVPVKVQAPWLEDLPGTVALAAPEDPTPDAGAAGLSFVLNDAKTRATRVEDVVRGGRTYTVLEVERRFLPSRAGPLELPAPALRFAYATRFEDDFIDGRVPVDRLDAVVRGEPLTVEVRDLPREGRPPGFTGAVGRFSVAAEAGPLALAAGESLKLVLRIEGEGNLGFFDPPRLEDLPGFHVYGAVEEKGAAHIVTYDLAPLGADVEAVPAIPFAYFDPTRPASYRVAHTRPIPIDVRGKVADPPAADAVAPEVSEPPAAPRLEDEGWLGSALAAALLLMALAGVAFLVRRRASALAALDPLESRAEGAAEAFASARACGVDPTDALTSYLAARLRCATAAVITPDLARRLMQEGVSAELAGRTAVLVERLVAARYGGAPPEDAETRVAALVAELETGFSR